MNIAILLTCHNRKDKTIACLSSLFKATVPKEYALAVFLVDDGSTDGTGKAVKDTFPEVNIIQGTGNLFWNQGMRLAWKTAAAKYDYDFYFWLNDDVILYKNALTELLACSNTTLKNHKKPSIIVGACEQSIGSNIFSYGGRTDDGVVIPNGKLQQCTYINGNAVLVPKEIYKNLGNLSNDYTHGIGDFDYGLRAIENGFNCDTTTKYIASCPTNDAPQWSNPKVPLKKRLQLLYAPTGLNYKEYITFRKKFWGKKWPLFALKAYAKVLFPKIYKTLK